MVRQRVRRRLDTALLAAATVTGVAGAAIGVVHLVESPNAPRAVEVRAAFRDADAAASPSDRSAAAASPLTVTIDDLDVWAPVRPVGLDPDGNMEIPDETEVGWYELGGAPGSGGATVLVGHVSWNDTVGPFHRLNELDEGAEIRVRLADGTVREYSIVERSMYPKDGLPADRIWRSAGDEELVLITCGGDFDETRRRYRQNVVVYAAPLA